MLRPMKIVIDNLNRIAKINDEYMRLVGYEKSSEKNGGFFLFANAINSKARRLVTHYEDGFTRYPVYSYIPFITEASKINRFLAFNGAPIVHSPVIKQEKIFDIESERYTFINEKYKGKLIGINTDEGYKVGNFNGFILNQKEDEGSYISLLGIDGIVYKVKDITTPFYLEKYDETSLKTINQLLS